MTGGRIVPAQEGWGWARRSPATALEACRHSGAGKRCRAHRKGRARLLDRRAGRPAGIAAEQSLGPQAASKGLDDLEGTLAKVNDDAPVILLAHEPDIFPKVPVARFADAFRPHSWRTGQAVRLFTGGAVAVRQPLRLWPCGRRRPQPDRLGRARVQHPAGPFRHAPGDIVRSNSAKSCSGLSEAT